MFKIVIGVLVCGWVFAGWRNLPRIPHPYAPAAGAVIASCMLLAYWAGTRRRRDEAVAVAVARAEAKALAAVKATQTNTQQVAVILDPNLGAARRGEVLGLDSAPWLAGAHTAAEIEETDAVQSMMDDIRDAEQA